MKAILVEEKSHDLYIGEVHDPIPADDELLVTVVATAVNRADLIQRKGNYPPPPGESNILGLEMAGIVEGIGKDVTNVKVGDKVYGLLPGGGYGEKVVIPAGLAMKIPQHFTFEEAASIPEAYLTAFLNLRILGNVSKGDFVLIYAAASGVGTAAIQLVKEMGGIPIAVASSQEKLEFCQSLGAQFSINYKQEKIAEAIQVITEGNGVQVILDPIGAANWNQNLQSISVDGRWIVIGGLSGYEVEKMNLKTMMRKRIQLIGSTLRSRTVLDKIHLTDQFNSFAEKRFQDGSLKPVVDRIFSWEDAENAHKYVELNKNKGKVVLRYQDSVQI